MNQFWGLGPQTQIPLSAYRYVEYTHFTITLLHYTCVIRDQLYMYVIYTRVHVHIIHCITLHYLTLYIVLCTWACCMLQWAVFFAFFPAPGEV